MTNAKSSTKKQSDTSDKATAKPEAAKDQLNPVIEAAVKAPKSDNQQSNIIALAVKAKPKQGFWRIGRFWPAETANVFVVEDVEAAKAENDALDCFISPEEYERLKAELMLEVTELETVEVEE